MKKLTSLGCLLALVFAGASAFAGTWFANSVAQTLGTGWSNTTGWTWNGADGSYNSWDAALTYTASDAQPLAAKDSTITTSVKFTAMDIEDLNEQTIGTDVKGGLTVVEDASTTPSTLSYYGIVNEDGTKKWMPLTGATPTLEEFVTVTVELKNNLDSTYTITYKVGGEALTVASGSSFTMVTAEAATISTVEYLGQFSLASLAGATWFNPVAVDTTGIPTGVASVKTLVGGAEASGPFARGTAVSFAFTPTTGYAITPVAGSVTLDGEAASVTPTWANYVTATSIPSGEGMPSKITVDAEEVAARIAGGAKGGENYLFTAQENGQLGWVNYSLGIADDATIAPTNAVQASENEIAVNFGVEVAPDAAVKYEVGGETLEAPTIALTANNNTQIVDVKMILTDEGGDKHAVATVKVGVMDTGKDTTGMTTGKKTFDIVAVPWDSMDGQAVTVATLLNTGALTAGDKLYVWDDNTGSEHYDVYVLTAGAWVPQAYTTRSSVTGETSTESPDPATRTIVKGTAVWIERDPASSIIFAGVVKDVTAKLTATVEAGDETEATWSLIANPSIKPFALSSIPSPAEGDAIVIEDVDAPKEYTYKDGGWVKTEIKIEEQTVTRRGKTTTTQVKTLVETSAAEDTIPAGIGFWYVRAAGAAEMILTFENNVVTE